MKEKTDTLLTLKRIVQLIKEEKRLQILGFVSATIAALFSIGSSYTLKTLIDDILIGNKPSLLWVIQIVFVGLVCLHCLFVILKSRCFYLAASRILVRLRSNVLAKLLHMEITQIEGNFVGNTMSKLNHDIDGLERILSEGIPVAISSIITIVVTASFMFYLHFQLALLTILVIPIIMVVFLSLQGLVKKHSKAVQESRGTMNGKLQELLNGIVSIKALNIEKQCQNSFRNAAESMQNSILKLNLLYVVMSLSSWMMVMVPYQAIMYGIAGTWYFRDGMPTIGLMLAFSNFANSMIGPTISIVQFFRELAFASVCLSRIDSIYALNEETSGEQSLENPESLSFAFHNLSFAYGSNKVLHEFTDFIPPNKITSIFGRSGSGKSTLLKTMGKYLSYEHGVVTVNNQDLRDINNKDLRRAVTFVPQEPFFFNGSIKENLLLANPSAQDEELYSVLKAASLLEFVNSLPEGINTLVGDNGNKLSGGQKQRLALAQALLRKSSAIILDEPTSSLDNFNERAIMELLLTIKQHCTIVISTHQQLFLTIADHVINLDEVSDFKLKSKTLRV